MNRLILPGFERTDKAEDLLDEAQTSIDEAIARNNRIAANVKAAFKKYKAGESTHATRQALVDAVTRACDEEE